MKQHTTLVTIEDKQIPIIHTFGKHGYSKPPVVRKYIWQLKQKAASLFFTKQNSAKAYTQTLVIQKWREKHVPGIGNDPIAKLQKLGYNLKEIARKVSYGPIEIRVNHGLLWLPINTFLNEGIDELWDLADGTAGTTLYDNTNARIGIGNSAAAVVASQTGLQGGSTAFAAMDATYPTSSAQKWDGKSTFPTGQAEFAWEEYTVDNGNVRNKNLFRALQSNGTKPSGQTWTLEAILTIA